MNTATKLKKLDAIENSEIENPSEKNRSKDILKIVEMDVEPNNPTEACGCRCVGHCSCDCDRVTLAF